MHWAVWLPVIYLGLFQGQFQFNTTELHNVQNDGILFNADFRDYPESDYKVNVIKLPLANDFSPVAQVNQQAAEGLQEDF